MKVLVLRPDADARQTGTALQATGFEPVLLPLSKVEATNTPAPAGPFSTVILTSANAVHAVDWASHEPLLGKPIFAVGDKTAAAAKEAGFTTVESARGSAHDLASLLSARYSGKALRLLYPCGEVRSFDMESAFPDGAFEVVHWETYRMLWPDPGKEALHQALQAAAGGLQFHYSAKSAERFCEVVRLNGEKSAARHSAAICISKTVADALGAECCGRIHVSNAPNEASMVETAIRLRDLA